MKRTTQEELLLLLYTHKIIDECNTNGNKEQIKDYADRIKNILLHGNEGQ